MNIKLRRILLTPVILILYYFLLPFIVLGGIILVAMGFLDEVIEAWRRNG